MDVAGLMGQWFWNLDPFPISRTGKTRNVKFGVWMEYAIYLLANDKLSSK